VNPILRALYGGAGLLARTVVATGLPGDGKLARSVAARRGLLSRYRDFARTGRDPARALAWFHAPSVGEGLQATPVMSLLRQTHPSVQQAFTHFSPSAVALAARTGADFHDYLPFDIAAEMAAALDALTPSALVFSKLDVWPVLVEQAARRRVRMGLISATMAEASGRRGALAVAIARDAYAALHAVGAIDDADAARLVAIGVRESVIRVTGDTRYDQVLARTASAESAAPWLSRFRSVPRLTLVAGSTWPADEAVLFDAWPRVTALFPGALRLVIAPHEPSAAHLAPVEAWARHAGLRLARFGAADSAADATDATDAATADVLLVDRVGVLGELYALADAAFVGGGFHDAGLHSVLEPAAFGAPVIVGPRHSGSRDAGLLIAAGGAQAVADAHALTSTLARWLDPTAAGPRRAAGERARALVLSGRGAAARAAELVVSLLEG
jgi:3-deoxy-D-manno-octulosonic-acid transferase